MPHSALPRKSALLVIDAQQSFTRMPYWHDEELPRFLQALQRLDAGCRAAGVPVVHVFHVGDAPPFQLASGLVRLLDGVPENPAVRFEKHTHNAFTDTGLDLWLRRQGVEKIIISGIRTEQCCETTARIGSDLGYAVDFVSQATLTFPMTHAGTGRSFSTEEIVTRTELVLSDRFARIVDVDACLASL